MILFASDLDNTLIYSYKKDIKEKILVEEKDGKALSYMTKASAHLLKTLDKRFCFIPVTTRSAEQYQRIIFPLPMPPEYALAANGGVLLYKGKPDQNWYRESQKLLLNVFEELSYGYQLLMQDDHRIMEVRFVDGLFLFTKSNNPEHTVIRLRKSLHLEQVSILSNKQKIYVFPKALNKGTAIQRLRKRFQFSYTISAGDSDFDIPMLMETDISIFPESLNTKKLSAHIENMIVKDEHLLSDAVFNWLTQHF